MKSYTYEPVTVTSAKSSVSLYKSVVMARLSALTLLLAVAICLLELTIAQGLPQAVTTQDVNVAHVINTSVTDVNGTDLTDINSTSLIDINSTTLSDINTTAVSDINSTTVSDINSTAVSDINSTAVTDINSTTVTSPQTGNSTDLCEFNPCFNGGQCLKVSSAPGGYQCQCPPGFSGVICQDITATVAMTTAATTPTTSPSVTETVHECEFNPCYHSGFCVRVGDNFTCVCHPDYTGVVCETKLTDTTQPASTAGLPDVNSTVPTTNQTCPGDGVKLSNVGCTPMEVVFMIEYGRTASRAEVDHEGDFVKNVIDNWNIDPNEVRVGVVMYHDTVAQPIYLEDYSDASSLGHRISELTRETRPSHNADLASALDFVRGNSFTKARSGFPRVVIPIVHQLPPTDTNNQLLDAAEKLKDSCVMLMPVYCKGRPGDSDLIESLASDPTSENYHVFEHGEFRDLENFGRQMTNCN